jgi:hypothetical protein
MELTWIAIVASLCMALSAVLIFVFAVKKDLFHNIEEAKYQVFWSDLDELVDPAVDSPKLDSPKLDSPKEKKSNARGKYPSR